MEKIDETTIPKAYEGALIEEKWRKRWLENKVFHPSAKDEGKPVYSMVIPPPNVTGILHMGHALNNTLQDILARFYRMRGFETLWMPGTDHAGIATQNVVERSLRQKKIQREDLGREKFIEEVWKWREDCGGTIVEQLKRLGCSCDWDRIRFTMDEGLSDAVKEVFIKLFEKDLIYKSNYIINWCPRCQTALSDEEVTHAEIDGAFYHLKYAIKDSDNFVVIATTRPETLLGDTAIGFHPDDERYAHLIGKQALLPLLNRSLKIIQDESIDRELGTGVLKITPAHDPIDFELGRKHSLDSINILNKDGSLGEAAGPYANLDRFEARKRIVKDLQEQGILIKTEQRKHSVGHCYRCDTIVEPYCSDQWFVRMKPLAEPAINAVTTGEIKFHPERWTKTYMEWMTNIRDWCISRQIWWGHRIPVYYADDGRYVAARNEFEARQKLDLPDNANIRQDEDVLDTWFSSWLWPFSTMGWPKDTGELKKFYPTTSLVTGYEIIFFWVARMIMAGFEFMGKAPFTDIYIHGIVRDDTGAKMSKSKGNVVNPIEIIDEFGADALRFSMISITAEGQDVYASKDRFEIGRNFANKIWNASRFVTMNLEQTDEVKLPDQADLDEVNRWILSRLNQCIDTVTKAITNYKFNEGAMRLYDFFRSEFCDWYVELSKPQIKSAETQAVLTHTLRTSLRLLHPFMPFITEEIWELITTDSEGQFLAKDTWPIVDESRIDKTIDAEMNMAIEQIQSVRNTRATWKISPKIYMDALTKVETEADQVVLLRYAGYIKQLARLTSLECGTSITRPQGAVACSIGKVETFLIIGDHIDLSLESQRMQADLDEVDKFISQTQAKLANQAFVSRAPKSVVDIERQRIKDLEEKKIKLTANLEALS